MLYCPSDPTMYLVELPDLIQEPMSALVRENRAPLMQVAEWGRAYLCNTHAELGRKGPVCPYAQAAIDKKLFLMAVKRGLPVDLAEVSAVVMKYRNWFLELEPRVGSEAQLKTILILFPELPLTDARQIIDATQANLKPEFVAKGLMIGEFHAGPPLKAGLWNPLFHPLFSPISMLVIRHMVPTDFPFLKDDKPMVAAYLNLFRGQVPHHLRQLVRETVLQFGLGEP